MPALWANPRLSVALLGPRTLWGNTASRGGAIEGFLATHAEFSGPPGMRFAPALVGGSPIDVIRAECHSEADGHPWIYAVAVALCTCWSTRADGSIVHQRELGRAPPWMAMSRRLLSFSKPWYLVTHRGQFHPSGWEAFGVGYMWRRLQCAIMLLAATRFRSVVVIAVGRIFYMWLALKGIASPRPLQNKSRFVCLVESRAGYTRVCPNSQRLNGYNQLEEECGK